MTILRSFFNFHYYEARFSDYPVGYVLVVELFIEYFRCRL